ncbi:hypothetical protein D3C81_1726140 [compost metagenome]
MPDQQADGANDDAPQHDFNQGRQCPEALPLKQLQQGLQPLWCLAVVRSFGTRLVFAKAVARDRFPVLEGRLFEDRLDAVPGGLAAQGLVQEAWAVG